MTASDHCLGHVEGTPSGRTTYPGAVEPEGTLIVLVLSLVLVVRAIGYPSEPWWSRWASVAILAVWALLDLVGVDLIAGPAAVLFVASLVIHVSWRLGERGRPWTMPRRRTKSRGDVP